MKIFSTSQIKEIDCATLLNQNISEYTLVKRVANEIVAILSKNFINHNLKTLVFAGKGNNGNDAIAVAILLKGRGLNCELFIIDPDGRSGKLSETRERLLSDYAIATNSNPVFIREMSDIPQLSQDSLIIDGIFGSGLSGVPKGLYKDVINAINSSTAFVISIDVPSGMRCDGPVEDGNSIIKANQTLTLEFPKLSFFLKESYAFTGEWEVVNIGLDTKICDALETKHFMIDSDIVNKIIKKRQRYTHKGDYGHALLIAGSPGMAGAAVLSAKSTLRSGVGLLTTYVQDELLQIMQISVPEAICNIYSNYPDMVLPIEKFSAAAIGPGLGTSRNSVKIVENFLSSYERPAVIDADAINIIATQTRLSGKIPANSILTPHPGEFRRLAGDWDNSYEAIRKQLDFSLEHNVFVVLKGAYTSITTPEGELWFNSSGNPGMATAGSGDVLTGVILALLAQGYSPKESALAGVYIHGLAGDIAAGSIGEESLIASDIIANLGGAFKLVKNV
ncbi:MAG: NAD(P)H-hydrate dehydratase [Bacteroidales bacterium]